MLCLPVNPLCAFSMLSQVTGSWDGDVTTWDDRMGREIGLVHRHQERVWALAADGHRLASGGLDGAVCVWDFAS